MELTSDISPAISVATWKLWVKFSVTSLMPEEACSIFSATSEVVAVCSSMAEAIEDTISFTSVMTDEMLETSDTVSLVEF